MTKTAGALLIAAWLHHTLKGTIMTAAQDAVDQITLQLGKAKDEILAKVADLETQIANGETPDLTALRAAAQALDDVVPDPEPEPEPTPEPEPEPEAPTEELPAE